MKKWLFFFQISTILFSAQTSEKPGTRLVVFISIDHFRPDLLTRFDSLYTGGFRWLIDHSTWFTNTHHEHAYTATGPGHFVLGSGRHPGPMGILGNSWYDPEKNEDVYCVEDSLSKILGGGGRKVSYRNIHCTALGDWVKEFYPGAKVYSIAGKDRASVFMGGKSPDMAIWYNWEGRFVTSDYYTARIPPWLEDFNNSLAVEKYKDSLWTRSLDTQVYEQYSRQDYFQGEEDVFEFLPYSPVFPIGFNPGENVGENIGNTHWLEKITLNLASVIVTNENLGYDEIPDILFLGLSATDWIVHNWGPFSQEVMDLMIKLDRYLAKFFRVLDEKVGLENIQFVLTSDHGGLPIPEYLKEKELENTGRVNPEVRKNASKNILGELINTYGVDDLVLIKGTRFYYNHQKLNELYINPSEIDGIIRKHINTVDGFAQLITKNEVINAPAEDIILQRFRNIHHPTKSPDASILLEKNWVYRTPYGTGHGTPYSYDSHVPLLFSKEGEQKTFISRKILTVDIAPTVAQILGVAIPEGIDGMPIREMNRKGDSYGKSENNSE